MGLMNRLRDKTHIILIILVLAFLATIVFEWGMDYLGLRSDQTLVFGSVNGTEIDYNKFEEQVQFAIEQQRQQSGEDPDETMVQMIREQVWEQMVSQILAEQEIERLGIRVTDQEIRNWVYNSPQTLPEPILRNFLDSTGQFNMALYQQVLTTQTPEIQKFWVQVEDYLRQLLLSQKLQSVITGTIRISEGDILQKFKDDNIFASFEYIFLPATIINETQITITEEELRNYYEKNKNDYKSEESVKLRYILFSDAPTKEDSNLTEKQLNALRKDFKKLSPSDSVFIELINTNSVSKYSDNWIKPSEVSSEVGSFLFSANKDSVSDVIISNDGYSIVRLLDVKNGDQTYANTSHILINFGADTNSAKLKAEEILRRLKNGEDFSKLAMELSDDPGSKLKGGNLGWFTKGAMVKEFEEAVMVGNLNEIIGPVKTQFGFHIIKVHDRQNKEFKAGIIKKTVRTSPKTKEFIRKKADDFVYISNKGNFEDEARKLNIQVIDIPSITKNSFIPGAGQNKAVTKFAFSGDKNEISQSIKIQGGYAVYQIVENIPAGYTDFEQIKETVLKPKLTLEKKLDILKQQSSELLSKIVNNNISSLKNINPQLNIQSADSVSVSKPNQIIGNDFDFNSVLFKLTDGQISEPIRTQKGYYIVQMKHITPFDQTKFIAESDIIRTSMLTQKKQSLVQEWISELKEKAEIIDNRDLYYR